jgi:uncharacterized protein (DUF1800 family)
MTKQKHLLCLLALGLAIPGGLLLAKEKKATSAAIPQMDDDKRVIHALNRFSFGPRPGDVARVRAMGLDKWFEQQLHPEKIGDQAIEARLSNFPTLAMGSREMMEKFPPPALVKAVAEGKASMPRDPQERAIYQKQIEIYQERKAAKQENGGGDAGDMDPQQMSPDQQAERRRMRQEAEQKADAMLDMTPEQRMQELARMSPQQLRSFNRALSPDQRQQFMNDFTPQQREALTAMIAPPQVIAGELQQGKLLRAAYSERQLDEVMTDFWFNHFNVFINKGVDRYMITAYERDVIRPNALGKFKDLLEATAKSPAMLFYLDNWLSVGPDSDFAKYGPGGQRRNQGGLRRGPFGQPRQNPNAQRRQQQKAQNKRSGLNENYAREIMELHTLGVNGGYTQQDVTELAKILTGWTIKQPRQGGGFEFNERMHQPGDKIFLGQKIKNGGEKEGEKVLEMLSRNPATARFLSTKLAMRFVADDPPRALVDRMADTFLKTDGDIREVLRTMYRSPEFWAPQSYRAKVKTPLEFVASAVRAGGVDVQNAMPLVQALNRMGMPLYGAQPPTGYSMKADAWVNSSALLNRMNLALAMGTGRLPGIKLAPDSLLGSAPPSDPMQTLALLENSLLSGDVSRQTHETIEKQLNDPQVTGRRLDDSPRPVNAGVIAGLILGSPEFQRR